MSLLNRSGPSGPVLGFQNEIENSTGTAKVIAATNTNLAYVDTPNGEADSKAPLSIQADGATHTGFVNIFAGDRSPVGVITADDGSLYIRCSGGSSNIYQMRGGTWTAI